MSKDESRMGVISFFLSLVPIAILIGIYQIDHATLYGILWPIMITLLGFVLLAFIVSIKALKLSGRRAWAVTGTVISGLELLYMIVGFVSMTMTRSG